VLLGLLVVSRAAARPSPSSPICLSSTTLSVCVDPSTCRVVSLVDLLNPGARDMLGTPTDPWYAEFVLGAGTPNVMTTSTSPSDCSDPVSVVLQLADDNSAAANALTCTWSGCGAHSAMGPGANVSVTLLAYTDGPAVLWNISLANIPPGWAPSEIHAPEVQLWQSPSSNRSDPRPGAGNDRLLHCEADGALVVDPTRLFYLLDGDYPGACGTQFEARYDDLGGLVVLTRDAGGNVKHLVAWSNPLPGWNDSLSLYPYHVFPAVVPSPQGARVSVPYPTAWQAIPGGDWRHAADVYLEWASAQPFYIDAGLATASPDRVPPWLLEGPALLMTQVDTRDGFNASKFGPALELLPDTARLYTDLLGVDRPVLLPMGWEHDGAWAGIFYGPAQPSDGAWANASAAMGGGGGGGGNGPAVGGMVSGFWWVLERNGTEWGLAFNNSARLTPELQAQLTIGQDGAVWAEDDYPNTTAGGPDWRGVSLRLCHGSDGATTTIADAFTYAASSLGFVLVSFDQEIGGGQVTPCYSAEHGHPPGAGPWMHAGMAETVGKVRAKAAAGMAAAAGTPSSSGGGAVALALCTEQTGELLLPLTSTSHTYQTAVNGWPWGAVSGTSAGQFAYLYHERMPTIGLPAGDAGNDNIPDTVFLVRQNFASALVRGLLLETGDYFILPNGTTMGTPNPLQAGLTPAFASYTRVYPRFPDLLLTSEGSAGPPDVAGLTLPSSYFPDAGAECVGDPTRQAGRGLFFGPGGEEEGGYVHDKRAAGGRRRKMGRGAQDGAASIGAGPAAPAAPPFSSYYFPLCDVSAGAFFQPNATGAWTAAFPAALGKPVFAAVVATISDAGSVPYAIDVGSWVAREVGRRGGRRVWGRGRGMGEVGGAEAEVAGEAEAEVAREASRAPVAAAEASATATASAATAAATATLTATATALFDGPTGRLLQTWEGLPPAGNATLQLGTLGVHVWVVVVEGGT
jgi:hypothetical protein